MPRMSHKDQDAYQHITYKLHIKIRIYLVQTVGGHYIDFTLKLHIVLWNFISLQSRVIMQLLITVSPSGLPPT